MSTPLNRPKETLQGLTHVEVVALRKKFGKNEVPLSSFGSGFLGYFRVFKDPMGLMILALAFIYFFLGEKKDAVIMLIAFIPVSAIDVFLEWRAERALNAFKRTFQATTKVFRDGTLKEIHIQDLVPQDWVALEQGQTIPADGFLHSSSNLSISEAMLTGESIPVSKGDKSEIFAGTLVLTGRAVFRVSSTGIHTKFGKVIELLKSNDDGKSPLQKKINHLVVQVLKIAGVLVVALFFLEWTRGKPLLDSFLVALTFGMASVPEEFPLVFTLYLSLGAWRLAKNGVLVKALPSVETLGSVDVICTDKTGTLTEGKFQLDEMISFPIQNLDQCWKFAILACEPVVVDAMEVAIMEKAPGNMEIRSWQLVYDYEFESDGKHMSHAWRNADGETRVAMKGAIEGVLAHCLDSADVKSKIIELSERLSSRGLRLLGLAGKTSEISGNRIRDESGLNFLGIMAFSDPVRASARKAIAACQAGGVSIKIVTGDHPFTARSVADQLGIVYSRDSLYTGSALMKLTEDQRKDAFRRGKIFSRVSPEQKYDLVRSLKNDGMVVAMIGDGVNDAPAMQIADIGISMGEHATDAARGTAKMVLTQSDFNGVVDAISEGRRIFSNLGKSFSYLIAFHVPVVFLSFFPPIFKMGELLMPIHIVLLELIVHPVSAFTFENLSGSVTKANSEIIHKKKVITSVISGILVSLIALGLFMLNEKLTIEKRRTIAVATVLFGNIGFVLLETPPIFTRRLGITITLLFFSNLLIFKVPFIASYLHFSNIPINTVIFCMIFGMLASVPSWFIRRKIS